MGNDPKEYEFTNIRDFIIFLNLLIEITIKHLRKYEMYFNELEMYTLSKFDEKSVKLICSEEFDLEMFIEKKGLLLDSMKIDYWELKSLEDKLDTPKNLLLNAFADKTSKGVSYWRFRNECDKKAKKDNKFYVTLTEFDENIRAIFNNLSSIRNYEHHLTDAKFIEWRKYRENQLVNWGISKYVWPSENIEVVFSENVSIGYLLSTYLSSKKLIGDFKKLLQYMKKDYSKLIGKSMTISKTMNHGETLTINDAKISINGIKRHFGKMC
ncbi:hypothetical protein [Aminipila sp.]|uniref:hypothetical protein n=1 Tax=Aminipila sp. TaxID=2060095 RepID=UPI002897CE78|nr:hypothetical protein [Aminipila sp.]